MRYIKPYEQKFNQKIKESIPTIASKMQESSHEFNYFLEKEFVEMFEEIIWSTTLNLISEEVDIKKWLSDKGKSLINGIKNFLVKIGESLKNSVIGKFMAQLKQKIKDISKECLLFFDDLKYAVIKNELILPGNKVNFKKVTTLVMEVFKTEKKDLVDTKVLNDIETNVGSFKNESLENLIIYENELFVESIYGVINENFLKKLASGAAGAVSSVASGAKKLYTKVTTTGEEVADKDKVKTQKGETEIDGQKIITFEVDGVEDGKNVTRQQIADTGIGIFTKLMLKLGVKSPRAQVALEKLGLVLIPVIITLALGIFSSTGGVITAGVGGTFLATGFTIFTVVCGLMFCLGVFMIMCWFRKPYPDVEDYIRYLEAWFEVYPDGRRPKEEKDRNKKADQFKTNLSGAGDSPREGFGKYEDKRLKKDTTCTLLGKLRSLEKKEQKSKEDENNIQKVMSFLSKRGIEPEQYEEERKKCAQKRKEKESSKRMISYKDSSGKYRTGVAKG